MDNGEPFTARPAPGEQVVGGVTAATREPRGPQRPAGSQGGRPTRRGPGAGPAEGAGVFARSSRFLSFELSQNKKIFKNVHQNTFFRNAHREKGLHRTG